MQTGALIVAAGKSSRMGDFKPMLQLGSISIAQRVINNFRQAGISKVGGGEPRAFDLQHGQIGLLIPADQQRRINALVPKGI